MSKCPGCNKTLTEAELSHRAVCEECLSKATARAKRSGGAAIGAIRPALKVVHLKPQSGASFERENQGPANEAEQSLEKREIAIEAAELSALQLPPGQISQPEEKPEWKPEAEETKPQEVELKLSESELNRFYVYLTLLMLYFGFLGSKIYLQLEGVQPSESVGFAESEFSTDVNENKKQNSEEAKDKPLKVKVKPATTTQIDVDGVRTVAAFWLNEKAYSYKKARASWNSKNSELSVNFFNEQNSKGLQLIFQFSSLGTKVDANELLHYRLLLQENNNSQLFLRSNLEAVTVLSGRLRKGDTIQIALSDQDREQGMSCLINALAELE